MGNGRWDGMGCCCCVTTVPGDHGKAMLCVRCPLPDPFPLPVDAVRREMIKTLSSPPPQPLLLLLSFSALDNPLLCICLSRTFLSTALLPLLIPSNLDSPFCSFVTTASTTTTTTTKSRTPPHPLDGSFGIYTSRQRNFRHSVSRVDAIDF